MTLRRSRPKTLTDRVRTAGAAAGDIGKAAGNLTKAAGEVLAEGARTVRDRAVSTGRSAPERLDSPRTRVLAAAGAAVGAAGAFALWRSRHDDDRQSAHYDPAKPTAAPVTTEARAAAGEPAKPSPPVSTPKTVA